MSKQKARIASARPDWITECGRLGGICLPPRHHACSVRSYTPNSGRSGVISRSSPLLPLPSTQQKIWAVHSCATRAEAKRASLAKGPSARSNSVECGLALRDSPPSRRVAWQVCGAAMRLLDEWSRRYRWMQKNEAERWPGIPHHQACSSRKCIGRGATVGIGGAMCMCGPGVPG